MYGDSTATPAAATLPILLFLESSADIHIDASP
jgi:hypothetical protein